MKFKIYIPLLGLSLLALSGVSQAATNQATYPGGGVTLTDSGTITVNASALAIVKEARLLDGTNLGASSTLPAGTEIYFVLYVDNDTSVALTDVRMIDAIAGFTVTAASFEILNTIASPGIQMTAGNTAAWAGTATWNALTWNALDETVADVVDQADYGVTVGSQVTVGGAANKLLSIAVSGTPATEPYRAAIRFKATVN